MTRAAGRRLERAPRGASPPIGRVLQRRASGAARGAQAGAGVDALLRAPGQPLDAATRAFFEPRFARSFEQVGLAGVPRRVAGEGLVVGPPDDAYEREADAMGERAARAPEPASSGSWLVDDGAEQVAVGRMRKSDFLARLRPAVCRAADAELARVGQDSRGCPYLERAFAHYAAQPVAGLERALRRFAPQAAQARSTEELVPAVAARVAAGVARWATTGEMPALPDGVDPGALAPSGGSGVAAALAGPFAGLLGGLTRLLFKAAPGRVAAPLAAGRAPAALSSGVPLESGLRQSMSRALGHALPEVRVHTGAEAASLNARLGSRAFALGRHVAFGQGEYQPGTPVGDALLAHELAHVVQQGTQVEPRTLPQVAPPSRADAALEQDADEAAAGAVVSLWGRTQRGLRELRRTTGPRLKAGLRLQMASCCGGRAAAGRTTTPAVAVRDACATTDGGAWRAAVARARGLSDVDAQAGAMSALVTEALCPLGLTVHTAGTSHPDTEHPDDYQPQPVVNVDPRLNSKTIWANSERGGQLLTGRGGHNFTARGRAYVVLGPLALDEANPLRTRQTAQHELYMVTHTFASGATRDEIELETWTEDFRGYFHQYMTVTPRPRWTPLSQYYGNSGETAQRRAVERLVDYYNNAPVAAAERTTFQRAFVNWMRRNPSALVSALDAQLHVLGASGAAP